MADPIHLNPTAPLAERVLLPGDPGRALLLAQSLLTEPKMFNHNRGLWGYTGEAADGRPLTIQSTGLGGPSAAIVVTELAQLGARRLVRVGTCGALDGTLSLGDVLVVSEAIVGDGTSRSLGAGDRVQPDGGIVAALGAAAGPDAAQGPILSSDLFYDTDDAAETWHGRGALAIEMEAATLFRIAERRGLAAGCVLAVSDLVWPQRRRIEPDALRDAEHRLGEIAVAALPA